MTWRRIHFWIGLLLLPQFALWVVGGLGFALIPRAERNGESESRQQPPPAIELRDLIVPPGQIGETLAGPRRMREVRVVQHRLLARPVYLVRVEGEAEPRVLDGQTGAPVPRLTEEQARSVAVADFTGQGEVASVEWIQPGYPKGATLRGYDYSGELPAYRVNFSNWKRTRIYVSPFTGDIVARGNVTRSLFAFFWTVHAFGYLDRTVKGNVALIVMGALACVVILSGALLHLPYFRRRRTQRVGASVAMGGGRAGFAALTGGPELTWRKFHFWIGLLLILQFALWVVSGLGFALVPRDEMDGLSESRQEPVPAIDLRGVTSLPSRIVGTTAVPARVREMRIAWHGLLARPVYVVRLEGEAGPRVFDGETGTPVPQVTEDEAKEIARADFTAQGEVSSVEWIDRQYQKAYDYYNELPAYRVNLSNWKQTRVYISPFTGEIIVRRNVYKSLYDFFWTVHVFGYADRVVAGNVTLIAIGALSLLVVLSGGMLYLPFLRRRRPHP